MLFQAIFILVAQGAQKSSYGFAAHLAMEHFDLFHHFESILNMMK